MDNIRALVADELNIAEKYFADVIELKNEIFAELNLFLNGKSKRIRSIVCLLYLKANNISISQEVINLLTATELIHNASLLHDDVIDNSLFRRGLPTLYKKFGAKVSVLSGDYLLSLAVETLLGLNNTEILKIFFNAAKIMSESEIIQFGNRGREVNLETYLKTAEGKTGSLFEACLSSAAILTGLDKNNAELFGLKFGTLFQINNDLKDESAKNDKENNLMTVADIIGIEKTLDLKDNYKEELSKLLLSVPDNKYKAGIEDLIRLL